MEDRIADRYRLGPVLGRGRDCVVHSATDENEPGRAVAVKFLLAEAMQRAGLAAGLEREWRRQAGIRIPHLMPVLDVGTHDGNLYAVLPLLNDGTLRSRLDASAGRQGPGDLSWLEPLAQGLDELHAGGLVHREVEPKNVYFDAEGQALLSDFGIAKVLIEIPPPTRLAPRPGTFRYASPEACKGVGVGPRSDQYSLAVMLYEALSGRLPHEGATELQLLLRKIEHPPRPLEGLPAHVLNGAAAAVLRALSVDPEARFESCAAFALAVRSACTEIVLADGLDLVEGDSPSGTAAERRPKAPAARRSAEIETARQKSRRALRGLGLAAASVLFCILDLALGAEGTPIGSPHSAPLAVVVVPWLLSILCGVLSRSSFLSFLTGLGPALVVVPWQVLRSQQSWAVTLAEAIALTGLYALLALLGVFASAMTRRIWRRLESLPHGPDPPAAS